MRMLVLSLVLAFTAVGCVHASVPNADRRRDDAQRLEAVLPTLQSLRVEGFRSQDWCRFIDEPRGAFTNILDVTSVCNVFTKPPQAFDDSASTDFETVKQALSDSGVSTMMVWNIEYDGAGQITAAQFDLNAGSFDRFSYLYGRDTPVSRDSFQAIVFEKINDHWWFLSDDFN